MKPMKLMLWAICLFAVQIVNAQTVVKKPADVFAMYFGTFVNNNEASLKSLNDYMMPTTEGQSMFVINFKESNDELKKNIVDGYLTMFPKAISQACKPEIEAYVDAVLANFRNAKYKSKNIELVDNDAVEDQKIAEFTYDVIFKVPNDDAMNIANDFKNKEVKKIKADELKQFFVLLTKSFTDNPKEISIEQNFSLFDMKDNGKTYYITGSPDAILNELSDFYFDNAMKLGN